MSSKFEEFMSTAATAGTKQFAKELEDAQRAFDICKNSSMLTDAAFGLRELSEDNMWSADDILFGINGLHSRYRFLQDFMEKDEALRIPKAVETLISEVNFDIADNGFLEMVRMECHDMWVPNGKLDDNCKRFGGNYVLYRLNCNECVSDEYIKSKLISRPLSVRIYDKIEHIPFPTIGSFASFLLILGNNDNYRSLDNHKVLVEKLDAVLCPEKIGKGEENGQT